MSDILSAPAAPSVSPATDLLEFEKPLIRRILRGIEETERRQRDTGLDLAGELQRRRARLRATLKRLYLNLTPWETVQVARHPKRPLSTDYLSTVFRDVCELHGDRMFGDDAAIITGFARLGDHKVLVVGHNKGKDVKERIACNFGCAHPEGYRKALLKMRLAEKYGLPVVCLIDTQGAYPGVGSEERGIAFAIATNLMEMSRLRTPIVSVVIGEGGSGGALGIGVADRVAMLQHAFYSVISPEGCAAILWKTADQKKHAADALKLTSRELLELGIVDHVIAEPVGGAHREPAAAAANLEKYLAATLDGLARLPVDSVVAMRQERLRNLGSCFEDGAVEAKKTEAEPRVARRSSVRVSRKREAAAV